MVLTNGQEKGLKIAVERYKNREPYTVIAGYAGTGKSTLVSHIVDALNKYITIKYSNVTLILLKITTFNNSISNSSSKYFKELFIEKSSNNDNFEQVKSKIIGIMSLKAQKT